MSLFSLVARLRTHLVIIAVLTGLMVAAGLFWFNANNNTPFAGIPDSVGLVAGEHAGGKTIKISQSSAFRIVLPSSLSVEQLSKHARIEPRLSGVWSSEPNENMAVFTPLDPLKADASYTLHIDPFGSSETSGLYQSIRYRFVVAGPPVLTAMAPAADSTNVALSAPINLTFDRPMVPLSLVQDKDRHQRTSHFSIQPQTAGVWRWISTSTVEFVPDQPLLPATYYTVSAAEGIGSVSGTETEREFAWQFSTQRPQVVQVEPFDGFNRAPPETQVVLQFNQPVELSSVIDTVQIVQLKGEESLTENEVAAAHKGRLPDTVGSAVAFKAVYGLDDSQRTDPTKVVFIPRSFLPLDSRYAVILKSGVASLVGDLTGNRTFISYFKSAPPLAVRDAGYESGELWISFNNSLVEESLKNAVSLHDAQGNPVGSGSIEINLDPWSDDGFSLYPSLQPSTHYTLSIKPIVRDTIGQRLPETYQFFFVTPPLDASLTIHAKDEFGIFEREKPPIYHFNTVNISNVHVEMAKLTLSDFLYLRRKKKEDWEYRPKPEQFTQFTQFDIPPTAQYNERETIVFDVAKHAGQSLDSGLYMLTASAPEVRYPWEPSKQRVEEQYFALTNMSIAMKYSGNQVLVWVTDLRTGAPVHDAVIGLYALDGVVPVRGRTDSEGFFIADLPLDRFVVDYDTYTPEFWVTAQKDGDFAFVGSTWFSGLRPWNFDLTEDFASANEPDDRMKAVITTDRPLYRAGDTVHFKATMRLIDRNGVLKLPTVDHHEALVRIHDAEGNELMQTTLPVSPFGSVAGSLELSDSASLGEYGIRIELLPEHEVAQNNAWHNFSVAAYRKPEFSVEVTSDSEAYTNKDSAEFSLQARYYFGAPMNNASVEWQLSATDYFFNKVDGYYSFALEDVWCGWWQECERSQSVLGEGSGRTNADGSFLVENLLNIDNKPVSQIVSFDATVTDANNQTVSQRYSIPVHKTDGYVGIRADDSLVAPGSEAQVSVITVTPDGDSLPRQTVDIALYKREWNTIKKQSIDGDYYYENEPEDTLLDNQSVITDSKGMFMSSITIPTSGQFRVVARLERKGKTVAAATNVYAWGGMHFNWNHTNTERLDLVVDQPSYSVGDTARILIKSPFQGSGVSALVTVEREQILHREVVPITSTSQHIEIPITEEYTPNAYVSVLLQKPRHGETFNENGTDTGVPAFRLGYAELNIANDTHVLNIAIEPNKERYLPGESMELSLTTTNHQSTPVPAEVSLAVVDKSVLALSGYTPPDLVDTFYSDRGLGVRTAHMLLQLIERFKPGSKGGGGGLAARERSDFQDTAFFRPQVVTDENGKATLTVPLPDNLTTWQLIALGGTAEHQFGGAMNEVVVNKQVLVRPIRPRFAVMTDTIDVGAVVHNTTNARRQFTVSLSGSGFTLSRQSAHSIWVQPKSHETVAFPIEVNKGVDSLRLIFTAQSESLVDRIIETVPVYPYGTPQTVATAGFTTSQTVEQMYIPDDHLISDLQVETLLSPTLASFLPDGLEYLAAFPYGCTEQTVSRFLGSIAVANLSDVLGESLVDRSVLRTNVIEGLQRLYQFQRFDGGFGYWQGSNRSYPYLSAYVLYALHRTQQAGYTVDEPVLTRIRDYLSSVLRTGIEGDHINLARRAYILFVLKEVGSRDVALLHNLDQQRDSLPLFAKAHLAMAFATAGDARTGVQILRSILNEAHISPRGIHFEENNGDDYYALMHSDTRTTAIVLQALVRIDPNHPHIPDIVRWLLSVREDGHWDTTQSSTETVLALVEFLRSTGELNANYEAEVALNTNLVANMSVDNQNVLQQKLLSLHDANFIEDALNDIAITMTGEGRLYYDLTMSYHLDDVDPSAAEEGISIQRTVEPLQASPTELTVNNLYKVNLTITVPEARHFVAVQSPHIAGIEAIDFSFATTDHRLEDNVDNRENQWNFDHIEFRDDQVFLFADYLSPGVYEYEYLVRATVPGTYKQRPARAWMMYRPEIFGQTRGGTVEVKP